MSESIACAVRMLLRMIAKRREERREDTTPSFSGKIQGTRICLWTYVENVHCDRSVDELRCGSVSMISSSTPRRS